MLVPNAGLKGSFTFLEPFNKEDLQKKILEVTSIRRLSEMYSNGDDPCNSVYIKNGLSKDDYINDLQNDVPVAVFTAPGGAFYTIPCNKIESIPSVTGIPYVRKVLAISLGALPYDYELETLKEDIRDILKEKLSTVTKIEILDASAVFYKSYEDHEAFERWLQTNPLLRGKRSYKIMYKELLEKFNALYAKNKELEEFTLNNYKNNVKVVDRPNEADLLTYTKKIRFEAVAKSLVNKVAISNFTFFLYNAFNEQPVEIYGNSFTKVDENTYKGMLDSTPFTLKIVSGLMYDQNIGDMFSSTKNLIMEPEKAVNIEIELEKPMNIRNYKFLPYVNNDYYCNTVRVMQYNDKGRMICNRVYNYHATNGDFTPDSPYAEAVSLAFGDFEDITEPLIPPTI